MDSLAIAERGYLFPTPGSIAGVNSECPFCIARHIDQYRPGDIGVMMQMSDAGRLLRYCPTNPTIGEEVFEWLSEPGKPMRLMREHWLTLPIEVLTVPFWLPALSLRNCFILDELAVWFRTESSAGGGFHWQDGRIIELARVCWEKKLPVTSEEVGKLLLAHGMPELYQSQAEHLFDFAQRTLIAARGRKPVLKFRQEASAAETLYRIHREK